MAYNQDAIDAVNDIIEAINEYGSSITIQTITPEVSDSYGIVTTPEIIVNEVTKALPRQEASANFSEGLLKSIGSFELSLTLYTVTTLTKAHKIAYNSNTYNIVYISDKVLQDTRIIYEVLVAR